MSSTTIRGLAVSPWTQPFLNAPNYVNASTVGSTGVILSIPAGAQMVRLSANLDMYLCWGSSGVATAAASTGQGSEFVPYGTEIFRQLTTAGTTMISAASTAACFCSQSWWTV